MPARDRPEDEGESKLDTSDLTWWAKQLGREPRLSGSGSAAPPPASAARSDVRPNRTELSDALLEADEAAAEEERERAGTASEIEQQMRTAEDRIREAAARLAEATTRLARAEEQLADVEEQRHTLSGEAAANRRAIAESEQLLDQSRRELAALHVQEARETFDKAVEARNLAVREAVSALEWIKTALEQLDVRRDAVAQAEKELRAIDPETSIAVPPEPGSLEEAWDEVIPLVRARLQERLEIDLVEAAAASQRANAIEELPRHLRELARQRRSQRIRDALRRQQGEQHS